ncbi:MAG: hypothetical protein QXE06_05880 [Candidatus Bathyarchaeia archaeon]
MIKDLCESIEDVLLFLREFDKLWKSDDMEKLFPPTAKNKIGELENAFSSLSKRQEIKKTFCDWGSIGVWNAADIIEFLLTSRLTMYIANCIGTDDKEGMKQAQKYLLYFINYLLLTNIHPPSETHKDHEPFHPSTVPFPRTYKDAQNEMRSVIASHYANLIFSNPILKRKIEQILGYGALSLEVLEDKIKEKFLPETTPPFLIKNTGLAKELFVWQKLVFENIGFVIPTLLYQRIFKGLRNFLSNRNGVPMVPTPDFLIIKGGKVMGIEVGRERAFFRTRKAELVATFSGACAIPTTQINVLIGNQKIGSWFDFGFKCNRCYRSFIMCKTFIEREVEGDLKFDKMEPQNLTCVNICGEDKVKECPDAAVSTEIMNFASNRTNKKIVHLKCLYKEDSGIQRGEVVPLYPIIDGLPALVEGLS